MALSRICAWVSNSCSPMHSHFHRIEIRVAGRQQTSSKHCMSKVRSRPLCKSLLPARWRSCLCASWTPALSGTRPRVNPWRQAVARNAVAFLLKNYPSRRPWQWCYSEMNLIRNITFTLILFRHTEGGIQNHWNSISFTKMLLRHTDGEIQNQLNSISFTKI